MLYFPFSIICQVRLSFQTIIVIIRTIVINQLCQARRSNHWLFRGQLQRHDELRWYFVVVFSVCLSFFLSFSLTLCYLSRHVYVHLWADFTESRSESRPTVVTGLSLWFRPEGNSASIKCRQDGGHCLRFTKTATRDTFR